MSRYYTGATVDVDGCADNQLDTDGDGVTNDIDACPDTDAGAVVDADGCATNQLDSDGDGVMDDVDECSDTPVGESVDYGGCHGGLVASWGGASAVSSFRDSDPVSTELNSRVIDIVTTSQTFAALKSDGSVVTWAGTSNWEHNAGGDSSSVASEISSGVTDVFASALAFAALNPMVQLSLGACPNMVVIRVP